MRRDVTVLLAALVVLLTTAGSTAVQRLVPPPGPDAVRSIDPPYVMLPVSDAPLAPVLAAPAKPQPAAAPAKTRTVCPTLPPVSAAPSMGAKAVVPRLKVYDRPDGRVVRTLDNPTIEGQTLNTLVLERRGTWLRVQLPVRPNHYSGWVFVTDVSQYEVPYRVVVQRCAKQLTVFRNGVSIWSRPVAVGAPRTPTPAGSFYIDFVTTMRATGAYGPFLMSIAGFSDVLNQFGKGGIGQIAIHGTNRPSSIGTAASHGCVRLRNDDLRALVKFLPEGTPVQIVD